MNTPPLIFCTGWATPISRMSDFMDHIAIHMIDYPAGFDFNTIDPQPGSFVSTYAENLYHEIREQAAPPVLVGWSTGALIALETALHWPDKIVGLILISGTACFAEQSDYPHGTPVRQLEAMRKGLGKRRPERVLRDFFARAATPETLTPEAHEDFIGDALALGSELLIHGLDYLEQTDLRSVLHQLDLPVTLLHGVHDAIIPIEAVRDMALRLPRAECIEFPEDGHLLPLLDPRTIAVHIQDAIRAYS